MPGRRNTTTALLVVCLSTVVATAGLFGAGCSDDGLGELSAPAVPGSEGRVRYVVTLDKPAPDLAEYRALLKENPGGAPAYVDKKRADAAALFVDVDAAVATLGGKVVERWWMSNQATVEIPATGVATVRAVAGVKAVEADRPLQ